MLYDTIVLTHEDIVLLSVLCENQVKLDNQLLSYYGPSYSRSKNYSRLKNEVSVISSLIDKLKSITQITYD